MLIEFDHAQDLASPTDMLAFDWYVVDEEDEE